MPARGPVPLSCVAPSVAKPVPKPRGSAQSTAASLAHSPPPGVPPSARSICVAVQQQAADVHRTPMASLAPPQRLQQVGQELFQALSTFLDFALGHGPKRSTSGVRGQDTLNVVVLAGCGKSALFRRTGLVHKALLSSEW